MKSHFLIFTWENNMPLLIGFGNGLKSENLCRCNSVSETLVNEQKIVKTATHKGKNVELILRLSNDSSSKIMVDEKEYDM